MEHNIQVNIGETITIGDVKLMVLDRHGTSIRLGIDAPPEVNIMRAELEPHSESKYNKQRRPKGGRQDTDKS